MKITDGISPREKASYSAYLKLENLAERIIYEKFWNKIPQQKIGLFKNATIDEINQLSRFIDRISNRIAIVCPETGFWASRLAERYDEPNP